jgi:beta-apo-4'-carotenal oxygenase
MTVDHPNLQYSSLDAISASISTSRKSFLEHKTRDVEFRLVQLRKLYWAYVIHVLLNQHNTFYEKRD